MPSIRPPRLSISSVTASRTAGERKKAVMNLPEPSGSSPPEKPPGITIIWAARMASATRWALAATCSAFRFRTTRISASPPASMTARAVSYSQLVPGNTGIRALGLAARTAGAATGPAV